MKRSTFSVGSSKGNNYFSLLLLFTFALLFFTGCGKRAKPVPPSLVVPAAISDLRLDVKPGIRNLVWTIPTKNADNSKPVDLVAFKIRLKQISVNLDSCRFCDEGFSEYKTINLTKPESGFVLGASFYVPLPDIDDGLIYVFSVASLNSRGWVSETSNKLAVVGLPEVPSPSAVKLIPSASSVELSWQAPALPKSFAGKLSYRVYRRIPHKSSNIWHLITPEPIADSHFIDVGLKDWQAYQYTVTTVLSREDTLSESGYSLSVQIVPGDYIAPDKLENFTAFYYEAGVQLVWDPSTAADLSGYKVYRRDNVTGVENIIAVLKPFRAEFFDASVIYGRTYYYQVTAFDLSDRHNESEPTPEIAVIVR